MKKIAYALALSLAISGTAAHAQSQDLQPQMSTQDMMDQMDPHPSHLVVPIMMMLILLLTMGSTPYKYG